MKKLFVYLLVCICLSALVLPLAGCGIKEKAEEAATEKILEKALGDKVDVDGDTVTIKGDNGEEATIGGQWPDSELAKQLPEFTKGTVASAVEAGDTVMIFLEKVKAGDFDAYLGEIKKTYSKDVYESRTDGVVTYGGIDGNQITVALNYVSADGTMGITISKTEQ